MTSDSSNAKVNEEDTPKPSLSMALLRRIEVWRPFIQVQAPGAHKIWSILEDGVSVFYIIKDEGKEAPTNKMAFDNFLN